MKYSKHSIDFKNLAVKLYLHYGSLRKAASIAGISKSALHFWSKHHPATRQRGRPKLVTDTITTYIQELLIISTRQRRIP